MNLADMLAADGAAELARQCVATVEGRFAGRTTRNLTQIHDDNCMTDAGGYCKCPRELAEPEATADLVCSDLADEPSGVITMRPSLGAMARFATLIARNSARSRCSCERPRARRRADGGRPRPR